MHTRLTVALVAAGGFLIRFLRLGAIENDHYVYLARAHQVLRGDWPVRDFADPGLPLGYLLSTLAAFVAGPSLLSEAILTVVLFAAALAAMFVLVRRASGSLLVALGATALLLIAPPRLYNSSKILAPLIAMVLAWSYSDRPGRLRAAALGAWMGVAFLFRHDYALVIGAAALPMLVIQHWRAWQLLTDRLFTLGLCALIVVSPWLIYVQLEQGLPAYLASAIRFSAAERDRTVSHWPLIYYAMAAIPLLALWSIGRSRRLSPPQVTFAALLVLLSDFVLLRDAPGSRLPDVYATTAVAGAIVLGALIPVRATGARLRPAMIAAASAIAAVALLAAIAVSGRQALDVASRWRLVTARLRDARPEITPDPRRAPLVDYIRRCTDPDDRIFIGGFGPELPVLAGRPFAAGLPDWYVGYYEHPDDVARARVQLARERVGVAVMLDGGEAVNRSWPALAADLRARGLRTHYLTTQAGPVELWVPDSSTQDAATGLPCAHGQGR